MSTNILVDPESSEGPKWDDNGERHSSRNSQHQNFTASFGDSSLDENPWGDSSQSQDPWADLPPRERNEDNAQWRTTALAESHGLQAPDDEWGEFRTFRTNKPMVAASKVGRSDDFSVWGDIDSFQNHTLSQTAHSQSDAGIHFLQRKRVSDSDGMIVTFQKQRQPIEIMTSTRVKSSQDENVLFDAEASDEKVVDEFGDFDKCTLSEESSHTLETNDNHSVHNQDSLGDIGSCSAPTLPRKSSSSSNPKTANLLDLLEDDPPQDVFKFFSKTEPTSAPAPAPRVLPNFRECPAAMPVEDDNDWGDFKSSPPVQSPKVAQDTCGELSGFATRSEAEVPIVAQHEDNDDEEEEEGGEEEEEWADFQDGQGYAEVPVGDQSSPTQNNNNATDPAPLDLPALLHSTPPPRESPPPSNIPPPALLIPLFLPLLTAARTNFFQPLHKLPPSERDRAMSHPSTLNYLTTLCLISTTLARIIAGRKLRWKRDSLLAQSMRIGPASSSNRTSGMKLTGLDKASTAKEEREVALVIQAWRSEVVGRLRSAATSAGMRAGMVPELAETMAVRPAKSSEGAIATTKPCALCGLKREERVMKADGHVEDSFGEWWVDYWGHKDCWIFWETQKEELSHR